MATSRNSSKHVRILNFKSISNKNLPQVHKKSNLDEFGLIKYLIKNIVHPCKIIKTTTTIMVTIIKITTKLFFWLIFYKWPK
jgi:hypothetical protein